MKRKFSFVAAALSVAMMMSSCSDSDSDNGVEPDPTPTPEPTEKVYYNVVWCDSDEGNTGSYTQAVEDLTEGEISFVGKGFEVPSTRSAYIFASNDGSTLYSYSYGGGTFSKYNVGGGDSYEAIGSTINLTPFTGSEYARCSKLTDELASAHNISTTHVYDETGVVYQNTESKLMLVTVKLDGNMEVAESTELTIPKTASDLVNNSYVWRVHMPVINGGKIYYGIARDRQNPAKPDEKDQTFYAPAGFLVMDYPSFENPTVVETTIEGAVGDSYGFRSPAMHITENGDMYQLAMTESHILKIRNSEYDNSYVFKLQDALGSSYSISSAGWHYVGNGIAYVPFEEEKGDGGNNWGLARVDLNAKTAVRMNVPTNLDMWEYQSVRIIDGKLYMAICPVDGDGHIYIFDTTSTSPDAFTLGASIKGGVDSYYAGIF